jgi:sulfate permease, SulP family
VFRDLIENPAYETYPGYAVVRLDGGLFFATAEALEERIRELALHADPPLRAVVLNVEGVEYVDSQGAAKLGEILDFAESAGIELRLARVHPGVASVLGKDGVLERLEADHVHDTVHRAVEAQIAADLGARL